MAIPDFQSLTLPVLRRAAEARVRTAELVAALADAFELTPEERSALLPSGRQTTVANRTHWALAYLHKAGLIARVGRGEYEATDAGLALLKAPPDKLTLGYLSQHYPGVRAFRGTGGNGAGTADDSTTQPPISLAATPSVQTPDDAITAAVSAIEAKLRDDLLGRLMAASPDFFERVVVDLLLAMGYGSDAADAGQTLGRGGDGGVDGVIREDRLGLDVIYIQAKRYAADRAIGPDALRSFSGALDEKGARKGVFITTSRFTSEAERYAAQHQTKRIVLLDGERLAKLMIANGVGMREDRTIVLKRLDLDYFEPDTLA